MSETTPNGTELPALKFKLTPEQAREKWFEALESGQYRQGKGHLCNIVEIKEGASIETYCCLGVACEIFMKEEPEHALTVEINRNLKTYNGEASAPPWQVKQWLGLAQYGGRSLKLAPEAVPEHLRKSSAFISRQRFFPDGSSEASIFELNDGLTTTHVDDTTCTFEQIAAILRTNPPGLTAPMPDPPMRNSIVQ